MGQITVPATSLGVIYQVSNFNTAAANLSLFNIPNFFVVNAAPQLIQINTFFKIDVTAGANLDFNVATPSDAVFGVFVAPRVTIVGAVGSFGSAYEIYVNTIILRLPGNFFSVRCQILPATTSFELPPTGANNTYTRSGLAPLSAVNFPFSLSMAANQSSGNLTFTNRGSTIAVYKTTAI